MTAVICTNTPTHKMSFSPLNWIVNALDIRRERKALSALSDAQLDDIGLSHTQAQQEATKPIWDVPSHWVC